MPSRATPRPGFLMASLVLGTLACTPKVPVDFMVPRDPLTEDFLDTPWPSDLLRSADGGLDLLRFPNPYASGALEDVLRLIQTNPGYAASGTLYFHVDGGVDESSLPADPAATLAADASMFLVEADTLARIPIEWQHFAEGSSFLPAGSVAVQPLLGAYPRGPFALVVTSAARAKSGAALGPAPELLALMRCEPIEGLATPPDCAPYAAIAAALGKAPDDLALVQRVTPADARSGLVAAAQVARQFTPEVTFQAKRDVGLTDSYAVYDGTLTLAQLQAGTAPYDALDGTSGGFVIGADGLPALQRVEEVPFVLTVPRRDMPSAGYCVVIYAHGTGGDLESGLGYEAEIITDAGCAMLAISEPLHATRAGYRAGQEEILTFNFFNPVAGRDNWRQSAIEKVQLVNAVADLAIAPELSGADAPITFNTARVSYLGHSQGGITGALFLAVEDRILGAFLSGAGAGFQASLVEKTEPQDISAVLRMVLLMPEDERVDRFHPVIALLQTWVDPADPINVGDLWRHRHGVVPHLVISSGLEDTFTPPRCHGALAASWGVPVAEPVAVSIPVLELLGIEPGPVTLEGNLESADGAPLTAGVLQYPEDGHFAIFNNPDAREAVRRFLTTVQDGVPSVRVR